MTWLKYAFTAFVAILVPVYWREYGPANFLWFSDIALFAIVVGLWTCHPLPASMTAVGVLLLETVWIVDFVLLLATGSGPIGLAGYMADDSIPVFVRAISLFHLAIPPVLFWMIHRLGYDRRAWMAQTLVALVVLPVTYLLTDPAKNINWVFGPGEPQTWMPAPLYLVVMMAVLPLAVYWPTHRLLSWGFGSRAGRGGT